VDFVHTVARLSIAPVKALALVHPDVVDLTPAGVAGDRSFYLLDEDGRLFKGKHHGPLVRIRPEYDAARDRLTLAFPDGARVEAPVRLAGPVQTAFYGERIVAGRVVDGPFAAALSAYAGRRLRLARTEQPGEGNDEEVVTLLGEQSVAAVVRDAGLGAPLDTRRFRMLVMVAGGKAYDEDTWAGRDVRIGGAVVRVGGPVPRCVVTRQNPDTGERDVATLDAIVAARGKGADGSIDLGRYAQVVEPGPVRVGDRVEPLR
jgi:uncharacterized protein